MLELHAEDSFEITGRGTVYAFKGPLPACCPEHLFDQHVLINDEPYTIKGVECFALMRSHDHPYPQSLGYGLLVEKWRGRGFGDYWADKDEKAV